MRVCVKGEGARRGKRDSRGFLALCLLSDSGFCSSADFESSNQIRRVLNITARQYKEVECHAVAAARGKVRVFFFFSYNA